MLRELRARFQGLARGDGGLGFVIPIVRFPVQVTPLFVVVAIVLAVSVGRSPARWALIVVTLFVSILVHELGHAWIASRWGVVYRIVIHGFGGLTHWQAFRRLSVRQNLAVVLAGPTAGLGLALAAALAGYVAPVESPWLLTAVLSQLVWINLIWSAFNLIPVTPLDGGRALEIVLCAHLRRGQLWTAVVGCVVAGIACVAAVAWRQTFVAVLLGALAITHFEQMQKLRAERPRAGWSVVGGRHRDRHRD